MTVYTCGTNQHRPRLHKYLPLLVYLGAYSYPDQTSRLLALLIKELYSHIHFFVLLLNGFLAEHLRFSSSLHAANNTIHLAFVNALCTIVPKHNNHVSFWSHLVRLILCGFYLLLLSSEGFCVFSLFLFF